MATRNFKETKVYKIAYEQAMLALTLRNEEIRRLLNHLINNPDKY